MILQQGHFSVVRTSRTACAILISLSSVASPFRDSASAQAIVRPLHSFGFAQEAAADPHASLSEGRDGMFYGTTMGGGTAGGGTVFRVRGDGTGFEVLHSF